MSRLMFGLGAVLILWGLYVLATGDFVATVDIAGGLVGWGVGAIGLGAVIGSLDRIADKLGMQTPGRAAFRDEAFAGRDDEVAEALPAPRPPVLKPAARKLPPMPDEPSAPEQAPPVPASRPVSQPVAPAEPELVREGVIDGRRYRFFSDGSIEAEGADGLKRYKSIEEAREHILREREERDEAPASAPPRPAAPAEPQNVPTPRPPLEQPLVPPAAPSAFRRPAAPPSAAPSSSAPPSAPPANRPAVRPEAVPRPAEPGRMPPAPPPAAAQAPQVAAAPRRPQEEHPRDAAKQAGEPAVTWESYLAAGSSPQASERSGAKSPQPPALDEEEWAEPFRMLLRGGAKDPDDGEPKKR